MVVDHPSVREWADLVRAEYLEMPGLTLTKRQMRRLWLIDATLCDAVVDGLMASGFLRCHGDDRYARVQEQP